MLLICRNPQSEPEYQTQEDSLLARKLLWVFHFVSVLCGLKESSWSVSLDYRKELIAKKHQPPPPPYFSSNLFIIQREPKGLLLCSRDREVFIPLCKEEEGGGKRWGYQMLN